MGAGKTSVPTEFKQLGQLAQGMIAQTNKPRKLLLQQMTEALRTGGVHAKIPMIQQAVSRANQATATSMAQTAEQLASRNIGGPFAGRILAGQRLAGEQVSAAIPTQMAQQMIQQTQPFLSATQSLGAGALAQTGQAVFASDAFNAQQFKAFMEDLKDSIMGGAQMGASCLHPDSLVETPDGAVRVVDIVPGMMVWSQGAAGARVPARVSITASRYVGDDHPFMEIEALGGRVLVSPNHPMPDGTPLERVLRGKYVFSRQVFADSTHDILVDSPTGIYFVRGLALGSTLDTRHRTSRWAA